MLPAGSSASKTEMDQLRLEAYVKVDAKKEELRSKGIPVMVSIMAPPGTVGQREDVDLVLCLHIRNNAAVPDNCERLLTKAIDAVVRTLGDEDRLAILPIARALRMSKEVSNDEHARVAMTAIIRDLPLLTVLEDAESILYERSREDRERPGHIIIISNSLDDNKKEHSLESLLPWRFRSVHALGFRNANNARTMYSIAANSRECTYGILDDEYGQLTTSLDAIMRRITSTAGVTMPIEVKLKCEQDATLESIDCPLVSHFISLEKKVGILWASANQATSGTNFVVYVSSSMGDDWSRLLNVEAKYDHVSGKANAKGDQGSDSKQLQLKAEVVAVKKGTDGYCGSKKLKKVASMEVAAEIVRYQAMDVVVAILARLKNDSEWVELHEAVEELCKKWSEHKNSSCGMEAIEGRLIDGLDKNMREMEIRLYNNYLWREYMMSWQTHHWWRLPLPPLFMDKQAIDELPVQLEVLAKAAGTPGSEQQGLPLLLSVKVPETGLAKLKTPFVDIVLVVDVSPRSKELKNIANDRLNVLASAVDVTVHMLKHKDRLAILPVESFAVTQPAAFSFLEMSIQGRSETSTNMRSLIKDMIKTTMGSAPEKATQTTQTSRWRKQLNKSMKTIGKCIMNTETSPASQGTTSTTGTHSPAAEGSIIKQLPTAVRDAIKMLDDRPEEEKDRVGFIIIISDSHDDSICQHTLSHNYTIHAFGFNRMHNARAMYYVASRSNGIYDVLNDDHNKITEAFKSCISRITTIVVVGTKVDIKCSDYSSNAALSAIEAGQFKSAAIDDARKSCSIWLGAIHATSVKNFILYMDNVGECGHYSLSKLFTVQVSCYPALRTEEKLNGETISSTRSGIDRYNDEEVVAGISRVAAVKLVTEITYPGFHEQLVTCLPGEMETMQKIFTTVTKKPDANLRKKIDDPNYTTKLVQRLPWEMCLSIYQYTREAGKARRAREIEKMKPGWTRVNYQHSKIPENIAYVNIMEMILMSELENMEANMYGQITEPNYYELLVERLWKELSPAGSGHSARDAPRARLMKMILMNEMEKVEAYFTRLITDGTDNKKLVEELVKRLCESCAKHAEDYGEVQLATEMRKMHNYLGKEMVAMICKEVTVPMYYKKLMASFARLKCLNVSERERSLGNARYALSMEKMEATLAMEMKKLEANQDNMETIDHMGYNDKLVVLLVREMCLKVCEHAQVSGLEIRLISEMEDMEDRLHKEMIDPDYYKELVDKKLSYLLSWLSFRGSCELKSHAT